MKNDPRKMTAKFESICHVCGRKISKGEAIAYWPRDRKAGHYKCDEKSYLEFVSAALQEDCGICF